MNLQYDWDALVEFADSLRYSQKDLNRLRYQALLRFVNALYTTESRRKLLMDDFEAIPYKRNYFIEETVLVNPN